MNSDFWSRVRWIANDFHDSSRVKIIGKSPHEWPKIVNHGKECIILFLTRYFMSSTHHSATNKHHVLISLLSLRTVFSDLTLWRHHNWSVMSREREVLALWRHIRQLFLHAQIGAKAIFTSEWQPSISISHHPVFTAQRVRRHLYIEMAHYRLP